MSAPELRAGRSGPVIHDIGYRHYTGPRLGQTQITRALYIETLRGAFGLGRSTRSKIMPFLLLAVAVVPTVIIAIVVSLTGATELPLTYRQYLAAITILVSLYVAGQAPAAVSRDLRYRTVSLYFSRPMERADYVRAKYGALATAVFAFCALPVLVLYAGALLVKLSFWDQTREMGEALVAAVLIAAVVAGLSLLIASITPRRGIGVAAVITVLIVLAGVAGALAGLGQVAGNQALSVYGAAVDPFGLVLGLVAWMFSTQTAQGFEPSGAPAGLLYLLLTVAVVAGSYLLLLVRYRSVAVS